MSFLHPEFLYYMLPPMFLLFGLLLTQKEMQATFFSEEVMEKLRVSANTLTLKARNGLFLLMGILMVIALSGPIIEDGKVEVKAKSSDIMIALDISDSMLGEDVYPNRLKLAKKKALELLKIAPDERIGVIGFAKNSYLVSPLSFDHTVVSFLLRQLNTDSITEKGTDFLTMLEVVEKSLADEQKQKSLLILSDGGDAEDFSQEIAYAKKHNISVFVLGMGTSKGAPIKKKNGEFVKYHGEVIVSKLNDAISSLATETGGVYIENVNSDKDIESMYKEIAAHTQKKELKSQEIKKFIPLFYYPLGLALFILLIATSSMSKREVVQVPSLFVVALLLSLTPRVDAGVLDFMQLDDAEKAYVYGDYKKSTQIYKEYTDKTDDAEAYYNLGNSLYKQGHYDEAVEAYEKSYFTDKTKQVNKLSNLGNAYTRIGDIESLKKAIKKYEESLKIEKNSDIQENLETAKKLLKQKKKEKKKQDKNKKDQKKKSDKKAKDDKKKQGDKGEKSDKKKDSEKKDKKSEKKSQEQKEQEKKDQEKKKSEEEKRKNAAKELKDEKKKKSEKPQEAKALQDMKDKMSDEEEKKWLKGLNKQQSTFLYRLNKDNKQKEDPDAKPW